MSIKLSDTQLVVLSAAAQRDDRCLMLSEKLKGAVAHKVATKLIAADLVTEFRPRRECRSAGLAAARTAHRSIRMTPSLAFLDPVLIDAAAQELFLAATASRGSWIFRRALPISGERWV